MSKCTQKNWDTIASSVIVAKESTLFDANRGDRALVNALLELPYQDTGGSSFLGAHLGLSTTAENTSSSDTGHSHSSTNTTHIKLENVFQEDHRNGKSS